MNAKKQITKAKKGLSKIWFGFFLVLILLGCNGRPEQIITGKWKKYIVGINNKTEVFSWPYDSYIIITMESNDLKISKEDVYPSGTIDKQITKNVLFDGKELTFSKPNETIGYQAFKLKLDIENTILIGEEKSWNGTIYNVKFKKVE